MSVTVIQIVSVEPFGETLSLVTTSHGEAVVANRREDKSFRWAKDEIAAYAAVNTILPQPLLEARGYWLAGSKKGMLGGNKGNRVSPRKFGPEEDRRESRGLLFSLLNTGETDIIAWAVQGEREQAVHALGEDLSAFFGATEHSAA